MEFKPTPRYLLDLPEYSNETVKLSYVQLPYIQYNEIGPNVQPFKFENTYVDYNDKPTLDDIQKDLVYDKQYKINLEFFKTLFPADGNLNQAKVDGCEVFETNYDKNYKLISMCPIVQRPKINLQPDSTMFGIDHMDRLLFEKKSENINSNGNRSN